jgi:hypothetical protein
MWVGRDERKKEKGKKTTEKKKRQKLLVTVGAYSLRIKPTITQI